MKTFIANKNDYLNRKIAGEDVISAAAVFGLSVMNDQTPDTFMVVVLNTDGFSSFKYKKKDGKFHVVGSEEDKSHHLSDVLTEDILQDNKISRWWKCVFFEFDGRYRYDPCYDSFEISDKHDMKFKELIEKLKDSISSLLLSADAEQIFLTGNLSDNAAVRYILQQQVPSARILSLTVTAIDKMPEENSIVTMPTDKLERLTLNANVSVKFASLTTSFVDITLPLSSIKDVMTSGVKWEEMLADTQNDYTSGDLEFKKIRLKVECDPFQNIFLTCEDMRGNRKVKQF